jgi:hypothetical protein
LILGPDEIIDVYMEYLENKIKYKGKYKIDIVCYAKTISVKYKLKKKN